MAGDPRRTLLEALLQKVNDENYPSTEMLDLIEDLLAPEEIAEYVEFLTERVTEETYPSMPLLRRLAKLV